MLGEAGAVGVFVFDAGRGGPGVPVCLRYVPSRSPLNSDSVSTEVLATSNVTDVHYCTRTPASRTELLQTYYNAGVYHPTPTEGTSLART